MQVGDLHRLQTISIISDIMCLTYTKIERVVMNYGWLGTEEFAVAVSVVALIQPWIYFVWKKLKPPILEVFPRDLIEVGYANLGNSLILAGSLRALHSDFIVENVSASVILPNQETRHFSCLFFREEHLAVTHDGGTERKVEAAVPQAIHVGTGLTENYNFLLSDTNSLEAVRNDVEKLIAGIDEAKMGVVLNDMEDIRDFLAEITHNHQLLNILEGFEKHLLWNPGNYTVTLKFDTDVGAVFHNHEFSLNSSDIELFRKNSLLLANEHLGLPINFHHKQITSWNKSWQPD